MIALQMHVNGTRMGQALLQDPNEMAHALRALATAEAPLLGASALFLEPPDAGHVARLGRQLMQIFDPGDPLRPPVPVAITQMQAALLRHDGRGRALAELDMDQTLKGSLSLQTAEDAPIRDAAKLPLGLFSTFGLDALAAGRSITMHREHGVTVARAVLPIWRGQIQAETDFPPEGAA